MRRLDFKSPEFHAGLNYTVRLGHKWADLQVGEEVAVAETDGEVLGTGVVRVIIRSTLEDVPLDVFAKEHSSHCRDYLGLYEAMEDAYGAEKVHGRDEVVSIGFNFLDRTITSQ
jgi:hypothetical protein